MSEKLLCNMEQLYNEHLVITMLRIWAIYQTKLHLEKIFCKYNTPSHIVETHCQCTVYQKWGWIEVGSYSHYKQTGSQRSLFGPQVTW